MTMLRDASRCWVRQAASIVAGAVLALQLVLAVHACVLPLSASHVPMATAQCEGSGSDSASCLIQCQKNADQIKPSADLHFDVLPTPHPWAKALVAKASLPQADASALYPSVGPPLQILFCSFQC